MQGKRQYKFKVYLTIDVTDKSNKEVKIIICWPISKYYARVN